MKYRILFYDGRYHVVEPSGEVTWHYRTWAEVLEHGGKPGHKIPAGNKLAAPVQKSSNIVRAVAFESGVNDERS